MPRPPIVASLLLASLLASAGCSSSVTIPDESQLACAAAADCPSGFLCHNGMCQRPGAIDTTPPDLAGAPVVTPLVGKAGATFTIDLEATEPLAEPPRVILGLVPPVAVPCAGTGGNGYRCTYQASGTENGGQGGVVGFDAWLRDRGRNETTRTLVGALHLDFAPPAVASENVGYVPDPSNPLTLVQRATAGTKVHVAVSADEVIDPASPPALSATLGASALEFTLVPGSFESARVAFEAVVPPGAEDGVYVATVTWADLAGNVATRTLASGIRVKTSRPALAVDQSLVTYVRSPWGNSAAEPLRTCPTCAPTHEIPAGPYFELAPADPLSAAAALPAPAFSLDAGALATVRVWSAGTTDAEALLLGTLSPGQGGEWPRTRLVPLDVPTAWLTGVDDAGNESAPVKVQNVEWVATTNQPVTGTSPHELWSTPCTSGTRAQATDLTGPAESDVSGADGRAAPRTAQAVWRSIERVGNPPALERSAVAYDSRRGRVVLFGGLASGLRRVQETWEWDGNSWRKAKPLGTSPSPRERHAMAYDSARGRVVLFGGWDGISQLQDTWEWNGTSWTDVTPAGVKPDGRNMHAMAYDAARGRVVMFGGLDRQDTWEWDGASWRNVTPSGAKPAARNYHAMAYDGARKRVVLYGGWGSAVFGDTWEWDGTSWTDVTPVGSSPSARYMHAMAYDAARGRTVMFGGFSSGLSSETWEWNGASWTNVVPAGAAPAGRHSHAMAYDGARRRTVMFGGYSASALLQDTREWDGTTWADATPDGTKPGARARHAMAYDSARGRSVLFGGSSVADTWEWDGFSWRNVTPAVTPSRRDYPAMAYDAYRGRVVMFGGVSGTTAVGDTWEWDGTTWRDVTPAGAKPSARYGHAMAYDGARRRTVLFGGQTGSTQSQETWEWDGTSWANVTPAGIKPSARYFHAMAYDVARRRTVMFGGAYVGQGTWEWDGTSWSDATPAGTSPTLRVYHAMAYDDSRGRTLMFGGSAGPGLVAELWQWDGASWREVTPGGTAPAARSYSAMAFDSSRERMVVFGGLGAYDVLQDTWELEASAACQPAFQHDVSIARTGIAAGAVTAMRVRAFAGASFAPGDAASTGATLLGWTGEGDRGEPGGWSALASNSSGTAVPAPPGSLVEWTSSSADEARRLIVERDALLSFQVRPSGTAGPDVRGGATVALDFMEVRVRYAAP